MSPPSSAAPRREGDSYVLEGEKTWISNGGIADFYCVFARTSPAERRPDGSVAARGISAFVVDADTPGFSITDRIDVIAPHPLATLALCQLPHSGARSGSAPRATDSSSRCAPWMCSARRWPAPPWALRSARWMRRCSMRCTRPMFGKTLADLQLTQAALADMATEIDAARLLTYRAAWLRDRGDAVTKEVAMAKMAATESAQRAIDRAVQMFGGRGVVHGEIAERLYRDIRALRIYEGATEVQKLIIARELLNSARHMTAMNEILQPAGWPRPSGYSNGIAASGRQIYVAGQIGWDAQGRIRQRASRRPGEAGAAEHLRGAGGGRRGPRAHRAADLVRHQPRGISCRTCGDRRGLPRGAWAGTYPAMSVVQVVALMEAQAKVEIEATAVVPGRP